MPWRSDWFRASAGKVQEESAAPYDARKYGTNQKNKTNDGDMSQGRGCKLEDTPIGQILHNLSSKIIRLSNEL